MSIRVARATQRQPLGHRVATPCPELAEGGAVLGITGGKIEATRCLGTDECAPPTPTLHCTCFECAHQGPTDTAKPRVRRDVVQVDLTLVGDRTHPKDGAALDRD